MQDQFEYLKSHHVNNILALKTIYKRRIYNKRIGKTEIVRVF